MTGCGIAVDAATRGLRVALVERDDIASGTSSKSSKMVHGGLRYLQQREFRLVYENLHERQRLLRNAPHLVSPLPFLIPLFGRDGIVAKTVARSYKVALWLYDLTGGVRIGKRHKEITRADVVQHLPQLDVASLVAGFLYFDARGDDARVALALARTAADHGAVVVNYAPVTNLLRDGTGRVIGATVTPHGPDDSFSPIDVHARVVVNAAGVFGDDVTSLDHEHPVRTVTPAKGVHLSVPRDRLTTDIGAVLPVLADKRSIFVVPWEEGGYVFIGTTDTPFEGSLDEPFCERDDVAYLLEAVNTFTSADLTLDDVTGVWAGLRPLLKPQSGETASERTADLSRRHRVGTGDDGVIIVTGGKWTTYRKMAQDAVNELARQIPGSGKSHTKKLALHGACTTPLPLPGCDATRSTWLWHRYGTDAPALAALINERPELGEQIIATLPYLAAEVIYAAREEYALCLEDIFLRRTRAHLIDHAASLCAAPYVAGLLSKELRWSAARLTQELRDYEDLVHRERQRAGLTALS